MIHSAADDRLARILTILIKQKEGQGERREKEKKLNERKITTVCSFLEASWEEELASIFGVSIIDVGAVHVIRWTRTRAHSCSDRDTFSFVNFLYLRNVSYSSLSSRTVPDLTKPGPAQPKYPSQQMGLSSSFFSAAAGRIPLIIFFPPSTSKSSFSSSSSSSSFSLT